MKICVYGAASDKIDKSFTDAAERLGEIMAERGHMLVFGGGDSGMMGGVARGVHKGGGRIIGVAPEFFNVDGILFESCDQWIRTETMRERKQAMEDESDAFVVSAGGIGTFEEFFEILTLKQLGRHEKAIVILNTNGYYDSMLTLLKEAADKNFLTQKCIELYHVSNSPEEAVEYLESYVPEKYNLLEVRSIKTTK